MKLATSCFRIVRSISVFSQLRKTNVALALPVLLALVACPLAHAIPTPAKYAGIEKTVSTAVANPQAVAVDSNGVVYMDSLGARLHHDDDRNRGQLRESGGALGGRG
jgi:hypothetical protein